MNKENKQCVLYDRACNGCGECELCDLDPSKKCDNCGRCIDDGSDYSTVDVDLIHGESDEPLNYSDDFSDSAANSAEYADSEEDVDDNTDDFRRDFGDLF